MSEGRKTMATYKGHNEDSSGNLLLSIGNGMTATVETGSTASQSYTKGAYVFFNNRFCKTTTTIYSGATLSIGSNLSETSIGAELTSHLRSSDGKEFYFDVKNGTYGYYPSASKVSSEFVPFGGASSLTQVYASSDGDSHEGTSSSNAVTISGASAYKYLYCYIGQGVGPRGNDGNKMTDSTIIITGGTFTTLYPSSSSNSSKYMKLIRITPSSDTITLYCTANYDGTSARRKWLIYGM